MDPTLAYMNYTQGPGSIGIKDPKNTNSTSYMRDNRWTPNGIQGNNNSAMYAAMPFGGGGGVSGAVKRVSRSLPKTCHSMAQNDGKFERALKDR